MGLGELLSSFLNKSEWLGHFQGEGRGGMDGYKAHRIYARRGYGIKNEDMPLGYE